MTGLTPTTKLMHLSMCKQIVGKAFGLEDKALPGDNQAWHVHYVGELHKARTSTSRRPPPPPLTVPLCRGGRAVRPRRTAPSP